MLGIITIFLIHEFPFLFFSYFRVTIISDGCHPDFYLSIQSPTVSTTCKTLPSANASVDKTAAISLVGNIARMSFSDAQNKCKNINDINEVSSWRWSLDEDLCVIQKDSTKDDTLGGDLRRRWTLAMAISDEGITDEVLVGQLERMRARRGLDGHNTLEAGIWNSSNMLPLTPPLSSIYYASSPLSESAGESPSPVPDWQNSRRVMLTCRELVLTERHYLSSLLDLVLGKTRMPASPLMIIYAQGLVKTSQALLDKMEKDPSARGVTQAFLQTGEVLETALVEWCGHVGNWFTSNVGGGIKKLSKSHTRESLRISNSISARFSISSVSSGQSIKCNSRQSASIQPPLSRVSSSNTSSSSDDGCQPSKFERSSTIRDLAILPTQRVTRYVLLFRGQSEL